MLQYDRFLSVRMQGLDDCFNIRDQVPSERVAEIANRSPPAYSIPKPTDDEPPAYTVAMENGNPDRSIQIQPRNWSIFAGFTLNDIKSTDRISLPLNCNELKFGDFYSSRYIQKCTANKGTVKLPAETGIIRRFLRKAE
ncbi:mitochondrial triosephosphate isomerase [Metarhizium brunneum]